MKTKHALSLMLFIAGVFMLSSCDKQRSNTTGWNYNDEKSGGFEYVYYEEQETGPGLVLIEGGYFFYGTC